jgi:hypothetical protein
MPSPPTATPPDEKERHDAHHAARPDPIQAGRAISAVRLDTENPAQVIAGNEVEEQPNPLPAEEVVLRIANPRTDLREFAKPYPAYAHYTGRGAPGDERNFECRR